MRCGSLGLLASALALQSVQAADVRHLDVVHDRGTYTVSFDVLIDADPGRVRRLLTDYNHLDRLSDTISESRVLAINAAATRVKVVTHACVLFLCKTVTRVEDAHVRGDDIETRGVPEQSDFAYARERWRVTRQDAGARVEYQAIFVPSFYVPPFVGPLLIKAAMRDELNTAARRLEALAQ